MQRSITHLSDREQPSAVEATAARMRDLIAGSWKAQIVHAFAALGIADALADAPAGVEALAAQLAVNRAALSRLLRAGLALGLVTGGGTERAAPYTGTPLLATLRRGVPGSMRGLAMAWAMPGHWLPLGRFVDAIRGGERTTVAALGDELWEYYAREPREGGVFSEAMAAVTSLLAATAATRLDAAGYRVAVDVGGASGTLLFAVMEQHPALRGIVVDLPHVVPDALTAAAARGLSARFSVAAGSFFDPLPRADLYLLKHVLHDWDDASCRRILQRCSEGLEPGGRVAIVEHVVSDPIEPGDEAAFSTLVDLAMLVLTPGRERTLAEFTALLAEAGLELRAVAPVGGMPAMSLLEAVVR